MRIIYFDGVCNLCNGFVDFVIQRDKKRTFSYAALQGKSALLNLSNQDLGLDSVVLLYDGSVLKKSAAVLKILKELGFFYKFISISVKRSGNFILFYIKSPIKWLHKTPMVVHSFPRLAYKTPMVPQIQIHD